MSNNTQKLLLIIDGNSQGAKKALSEVSSGVSSTTKVAAAAKAAFLIAGTAVVAYGVSSVKAFADSEKYQTRLKASLEASGLSWQQYGGKIDSAVTSMMMLGAYSDEQLNGALARLVQTTGDVDESLRLASLSMDVARGTGKDLESTAVVIGKVYSGNVGILKRFGISIGDVKDSEQALGILQQKFSGQAKAYGDTTAGAMEKVTIALDEIKEAFGKGIVEGIDADFSKAGPTILALSGTMETLGRSVGWVADQWKGVWTWATKRELKEAQDMASWDRLLGKDEAAAGWERKAGELTAKLKDLEGGSDAATASTNNLSGAFNEQADASTDATTEIAKQVRSIKGLLVAEDELAGTTRTAKDAQLDYLSAVLDSKDAHAEVAKLVKEGKTGTEEYTRALIDQERADLRLADATQIGREEQHKANLALITGSSNTKVLSSSQQTLAGKLNAATDKVGALTAKLATVPKSKQTEIKAEIAKAQANVNRIKAEIAGVKGKTVTITVRRVGHGIITVDIGGKHTGITFAEGGIAKKATYGVFGEASPRFGEYLINADRLAAGDTRQRELALSLIQHMPQPALDRSSATAHAAAAVIIEHLTVAEGARFVVSSDLDVRRIADELGEMTYVALRAKGIVR